MMLPCIERPRSIWELIWMSFLLKLRETSTAIKREFAMVFADAVPIVDFHSSFFPSTCNWSNSDGRFLITTCDQNAARNNVCVEGQDEMGTDCLGPTTLIRVESKIFTLKLVSMVL